MTEDAPIERRFKIRPTTTADIPQLERVESSAAALFLGTDRAWIADDEPTAPEEHADAIADGLHWVAEIAGTAIGFVYGKRIEDSVYVGELCVARPYQRQGVGRRLMEAVERHARDTGAARVTLTTYRDLPWNMPFYQSIGFEETDPLPPHLEAQLAREAAAGHDPALRVGLVKAVG